MEPQTRANQLLSQIASLVGIDLSARIIEELVFNKCAELRIPIVIRACDYLPRKIRVVFPSASAKGAARSSDVDTRGFGIVTADPAARIRLKSSKRESPDEVRHKRPSVNEGSHATASQHITVGLSQGEVTAAPEAVPEKVAFNGRTKYTRAKDVTELDTGVAADVVFR